MHIMKCLVLIQCGVCYRLNIKLLLQGGQHFVLSQAHVCVYPHLSYRYASCICLTIVSKIVQLKVRSIYPILPQYIPISVKPSRTTISCPVVSRHPSIVILYTHPAISLTDQQLTVPDKAVTWTLRPHHGSAIQTCQARLSCPFA